MFCGSCGADAGNSRFCSYCGEKVLVSSKYENSKISKEQNDGRELGEKTPAIASLVIGIVGLIPNFSSSTNVVLGVICSLISLTGMILGIVSIKKEKRLKGIAIAGTVVSGIGVGLFTIGFSIGCFGGLYRAFN